MSQDDFAARAAAAIAGLHAPALDGPLLVGTRQAAAASGMLFTQYVATVGRWVAEWERPDWQGGDAPMFHDEADEAIAALVQELRFRFCQRRDEARHLRRTTQRDEAVILADWRASRARCRATPEALQAALAASEARPGLFVVVATHAGTTALAA
jgi:hypothetical protein